MDTMHWAESTLNIDAILPAMKELGKDGKFEIGHYFNARGSVLSCPGCDIEKLKISVDGIIAFATKNNLKGLINILLQEDMLDIAKLPPEEMTKMLKTCIDNMKIDIFMELCNFAAKHKLTEIFREYRTPLIFAFEYS